MKTVVQLMDAEDIYTDNLQRTLQKNKEFCRNFRLEAMPLETERVHFENRYPHLSKRNIIGKIIYWLCFNAYLNQNKPFYKDTIANIQFVDSQYVFLLPYLKKNFSKIVLSFWGSDLLRQQRWRLNLLKLLFNQADYITFETDEMIGIFQKKVGKKYNKKIRKANFGLPMMDTQDQLTNAKVAKFAEKYRINMKKKCIVVGYNRNEAHQHYEVIKSLAESEIQKEEYLLIIPWTYGPQNLEYREQLESLLRDNFEYVFLETFMNQEDIACLRACTDILFQVQVTDSLSATMLETLYAEKEVITGSWLPYRELVDAGISMTFVDEVSDSGKALEKVIQKPTMKEKLENNKEIIRKKYSWEASIGKWISLYM